MEVVVRPFSMSPICVLETPITRPSADVVIPFSTRSLVSLACFRHGFHLAVRLMMT